MIKLLLCGLLGVGGLGTAHARCAEDLTRIALTAARMNPDVRNRAASLASEAEAKARAHDAVGCEALTRQALILLNLPELPALQLSTPRADAPPAQPNQPSRPAASPRVTSPDPRGGKAVRDTSARAHGGSGDARAHQRARQTAAPEAGRGERSAEQAPSYSGPRSSPAAGTGGAAAAPGAAGVSSGSKARPGEGASGPTAGSGRPAGADTSTVAGKDRKTDGEGGGRP